ncbi:MAG: iron-siderophore ABC transporter substrate-binding protein [Cyanobacteria bacterium P01_C01_bin.89]
MCPLKRIAHWLVLSVVTAGLIIGCGLSAGNLSGNSPALKSTESPSSSCRLVKHDAGETQVCGQPQKVAALSAYTLNLLLSLDHQPAGYAAPLNIYLGEVFDNPARQIAYFGDRIITHPVNLGKSAAPSLEKLIALKPDLIVAEGNGDYSLLSQIAPTLICQTRGQKGQWQQSLRSLAIALGKREKAEAVIQQHAANIARARADLADSVAAHPKLLLLGSQRLDQGLFAFTKDSDLVSLLGEVGFQLVSPPPGSVNLNMPVSVEKLPVFNDADSIIVLGYDTSIDQHQKPSNSESASELMEKSQTQSIQQDWEASEIAQLLTASQEGRVFFATIYKWLGINPPIGAELVLEQLRQFFLSE